LTAGTVERADLATAWAVTGLGRVWTAATKEALMAETAERVEVATAQAVANTMEEEAMTSTAAREAIPLSVGRAMLLTPVAWPSLPAMRAASAASPLARFPV